MIAVLIIAAVFNLATAGFMIVIGAYPAPVFLGLDMLAICTAFYSLDRRRRLRQERIEVTGDRIAVFRPPTAPAPIWEAAPVFTRVRLMGQDSDLPILRLTSSGRTVTLATELGAEGRLALAEDIQHAIQQARAERH